MCCQVTPLTADTGIVGGHPPISIASVCNSVYVFDLSKASHTCQLTAVSAHMLNSCLYPLDFAWDELLLKQDTLSIAGTTVIDGHAYACSVHWISRSVEDVLKFKVWSPLIFPAKDRPTWVASVTHLHTVFGATDSLSVSKVRCDRPSNLAYSSHGDHGGIMVNLILVEPNGGAHMHDSLLWYGWWQNTVERDQMWPSVFHCRTALSSIGSNNTAFLTFQDTIEAMVMTGHHVGVTALIHRSVMRWDCNIPYM